MTSRWPICFKIAGPLLALAALLPAAQVAGQVNLSGSREAIAHARGASKIVLWLTPLDSHAVPLSSAHAVMLQKRKQFVPHILAVQAGATVDFPNADPIFHNAFSSFDGQIFDIGLYPPGSSRAIRFRRAGIVRVFCNIHPAMSAVIVVLDTPYFATPADDGKFTIDNVPPGEYRLSFFHEQATSETLDALTQAVTVSSQIVNLPPIVISVANYIPFTHKNKYGQDYPPAPPDYPVIQ